MIKKMMKNVSAWILSIVMLSSMLITGQPPLTVHAEEAAPRGINLNIRQSDDSYSIAGITDPARPENDTDAWTGTKVYYGQYNEEPILFRVLDADSTDYGSDHTMFLDCDTVLEQRKFQTDFGVATPNAWETSEIREWMQGSTAGQFLNGFTIAERGAIAASTRTDMTAEGLPVYTRNTFNWCNLDKDKVFALDAREASNPAYGYSTTDNSAGNKMKLSGSAGACWWLRSASANYTTYVGVVDSDGSFYEDSVVISDPGVSPALNLNLLAVLFASANGVSKSSDTLTEIQPYDGVKEWKLTLWDSNMSVNVTDGERITQSGNTITVPYTYAGSNVDQISVMITSGAYNVPGTEILYYGKLNTTDSLSGSNGNGTGTFSLPSGLPEGYKMYILAEDVNGAKYTDYASTPVEIVTHSHTWDMNWTSDDTYHWHKCTAAGCDGSVTAKAEHTESAWITDKEATATVEGAKHTECTVCHKVMQTGTIPKIEVPDEGDTEEADTVYYITGGANQTVKENFDGTITIICNGELSKFVSVSVDGTKADSKNYTLKSGSTILTFTKEYVDSLSVGTHTVRFEYTDGSVETNLTVEKADNTPEVSPKTGDNTSVVWFVLCMFSGVFFISYEVVRRKRV